MSLSEVTINHFDRTAIHKKTGKKYSLFYLPITNATNEVDGQLMAVYANEEGDIFCREWYEFVEKFDLEG
jgi:hypothetical protein